MATRIRMTAALARAQHATLGPKGRAAYARAAGGAGDTRSNPARHAAGMAAASAYGDA